MDKRLGCKFCFKTLDPSEADGNLRTFIKCANCGALYHEVCWRDTQDCIDCAGTIGESVDVPDPNPLRVSSLRKPLQSQIFDQTVIQIDSGPSLTKVVIGVVTLITIGIILWQIYPIGNLAIRNAFQSGSGSNEAQATTLPSVTPTGNPLVPTKQIGTNESEDTRATSTAQPATPTLSTRMTPSPASADEPVAEVSAENLNIRTGPGTEYAKEGILRNGSQVQIVGKNNGWWQVRLDDGSFGWISMKYAPARGSTEQVPDVPAPSTRKPEPTQTPGPTSRPAPVAVTSDNRGDFSDVQEGNGWSYLVEDGRNSGNYRPMPRFDGGCWHSDNWEQDMRICADGEVHPGNSGRIAYQWRVPDSGQYTIDVHAHKIDTRCGDGVWIGTYRVADERSGPRMLGDFQIAGGDNTGRTASYAEYFDQGNLLLIMVDIRGESTCDMTRLEIDIR